ncbi:MAG TPA: glutathione S-transferase family protein [Candidatus Binatia bacterium]|jgi:glutathione S-transferase/RNA polymerase-associated protein|nr:glutathione S-transferase family protein [Candidatus Binatia bacterium]
MVVLHEHPLSPYAQKVKIALTEKAVPFESRLPDILGGALGEFAQVSPRLEVPALLDGDVAIFDSTIILEYIEDRWPEPALLPATPAERARVRMLEELCDTYYEAINWACFEITVFQRATAELADRLMSRAHEQRAGINAYLDRALGARSWFNGETFGWGDIAVVPFVHAASFTGAPPAPGSALADWLERVRARPSVAQTFDAAQSAMGGFEMLPHLVASGHFKREYRDHRLEWMLRSGGVEIVLEGMRKANIRFSQELA